MIVELTECVQELLCLMNYNKLPVRRGNKMQEAIMSFYDSEDEMWKYYSIHGTGLYFDSYEKALRDELIGLGIIKPLVR